MRQIPKVTTVNNFSISEPERRKKRAGPVTLAAQSDSLEIEEVVTCKAGEIIEDGVCGANKNHYQLSKLSELYCQLYLYTSEFTYLYHIWPAKKLPLPAAKYKAITPVTCGLKIITPRISLSYSIIIPNFIPTALSTFILQPNAQLDTKLWREHVKPVR